MAVSRILLIVATAWLAGPSHAATITGSSTFSLFDGTVAGDTITTVGSFQPFDPALGTLTAVDFTMVGSLSSGLLLDGLAPGSYSATALLRTTFSGPGGSLLYDGGTGALGFTLPYTVAPDGTVSAFGTGVPFQASLTDGNSFFQPVTITSHLDLFTVAGTTFTGAVALSWEVQHPDGSVQVLPASSAGRLLTVSPGVTYTFTPGSAPVPEPGAALLMGLGLVVFGAASRRQRADA